MRECTYTRLQKVRTDLSDHFAGVPGSITDLDRRSFQFRQCCTFDMALTEKQTGVKGWSQVESSDVKVSWLVTPTPPAIGQLPRAPSE